MQEKFPLPNMESYLTAMRNELLNGKGFILFKGFPVEAWGNHKSAVAYMGLGTYLGYFVSQNGLGHVLGHVKVCEARDMDHNVDTDETIGHRSRSNPDRQSTHLPYRRSPVLPC